MTRTERGRPSLRDGAAGARTDPRGCDASTSRISEGQRAWAAAQIASLPRGLRADRVDAQICASTSHAEAAALLNVSRRGVQNAAVVRDHGVPELQALVALGDAAPSTGE